MEKAPHDFIRSVLAVLDPVSVAAAACTCKEWRGLANEQWPVRLKQWRFGREPEGCDAPAVFGRRWKIDKVALACIDALAHPCEREKALTKLREMGDGCLDVLMAASQLYKGGPKDSQAVTEALEAVQTQSAATQLRCIANSKDCDLARLETGALCIAQVHAPEVAVHCFVSSYLDLLAGEALARIRALASTLDRPTTNRHALDVVNGLLFGPRHPDHPFPHASSPRLPLLSNPLHAAAWDAYAVDAQSRHAGNKEFLSLAENGKLLPPDGFGLGLQGNTEDFFHTSNNLLHDVLGRTGLGTHLSLGITHASVCQRLGLPVYVMKMPLHPINGMCCPLATFNHSTRLFPAKNIISTSALERLPPQSIRLYIDLFQGGRVHDWDDIVRTISQRGNPLAMAAAQVEQQGPFTPKEIACRILNHSYGTHKSTFNYGEVRKVAELINQLNPKDDGMIVHRLLSALLVNDPGDAEEALHILKDFCATEPSIAYAADIPIYEGRIKKLRQVLAVRRRVL